MHVCCWPPENPSQKYSNCRLNAEKSKLLAGIKLHCSRWLSLSEGAARVSLCETFKLTYIYKQFIVCIFLLKLARFLKLHLYITWKRRLSIRNNQLLTCIKNIYTNTPTHTYICLLNYNSSAIGCFIVINSSFSFQENCTAIKQ